MPLIAPHARQELSGALFLLLSRAALEDASLPAHLLENQADPEIAENHQPRYEDLVARVGVADIREVQHFRRINPPVPGSDRAADVIQRAVTVCGRTAARVGTGTRWCEVQKHQGASSNCAQQT